MDRTELASASLAHPDSLMVLNCSSSSARLIDARYAPSTEFDTHEHDESYFCLVLHGGYEEWREGEAPVRRFVGHDTLYPAGSRHAVRSGAVGARILHVTDPSGRNWLHHPAPLASGLLRQVGVAMTELRRHAQDAAAALHIESLVHELAGHSRSSQVEPGWLDQVRDRLRCEHRAAPTLQSIAHEVGRHPTHVARAFKKSFGMSLGEFVRRIRTAAAVRLLQRTDQPLAAVAREAGFADQSHMGRWLKRYLGTTPLEIRESADSA